VLLPGTPLQHSCRMEINSGDTAWVLTCTALVLLMTPGLAFFYAGMVRAKNALTMLMQNFACIAIVSVTWVLVGYTLAFGDGNGLFGGFRYTGLAHTSEPVPGLTLTIPPLLFVVFQLMFAILTAALLTGALADRVRFAPFLLVIALWSVLVYAPLAHWVFSPGGWMFEYGVLDFAGGYVVEICSGASALALALVAGRRMGWPRDAMPPHSLPFTLLGAGLLWFGWFGFNAGSALAANELSVSALVGTHLAGVGGLIGWVALEWLRTGSPTTLGAASGAVSGLVAITPACGFLEPLAALGLGVVAGMVCLLAVQAKHRLGYDDALDVVGVHWVGGVLGTLAIGFAATTSVNSAVVDEGLFYGGGVTQLGRQAVAVVAASAFAFAMTWLIAKVVDVALGLRVSQEDEFTGLDQALHAETAYDLGSVRTTGRMT
jgi:Amt family ammonium transporter